MKNKKQKRAVIRRKKTGKLVGGYMGLSDKTIFNVMKALMEGSSLSQQAKKYGGSVSNISNIADGSGKRVQALMGKVPGFKAWVAARKKKKLKKNHHMTKKALKTKAEIPAAPKAKTYTPKKKILAA